MKYLVTGAGGQLGRQWINELETRGLEHVSFDRKSLDITDRELVENALRKHMPDVFINCAAYTKVDQAEDEPEKAELINGHAAGLIAEICALQGIKLVHYSTDYVFPGKADDEHKYPDGYPEDAPTDPVNEYGKSKLSGEHRIIKSGADHLIIRVSWLCGEYGNNFVKTMIRLGSEREELSVVNDQIGCPAFAGPVVMNTIELIRRKQKGIFHLRSEGKITWFDLASTVFEEQEMSVKVNPVSSEAFPTKAKRPKFSLLNIDKAAASEGIVIREWKDDLKEMLNKLN